MKRKALLIVLAAALLLSAASGCGKRLFESEPTATPSPTLTPDPHAGMVEVMDGNGGTIWIDEAEDLTVFGPDRAAVAVTNDAALYNGSGWSLQRGIDVSAHQGDIDWQAVADAGIEFAILRCAWRGYGEGSLYEDDYFRQNIEGALAAGLDVGAYVFSQATNIVEAAEEAVFAIRLLEDYEVALPLFFDWERISEDGARTANTSGETITACMEEFCRLVEAAGYTPGVYSYLHLAYYDYDLNALAGKTVWIANPSAYPEFYYEHQFWQYSFVGSIAGIDGDVDLDVLFVPEGGVPAAAPADASGAAPVEPVPEAGAEPAADGETEAEAGMEVGA